MSFTGKSWLQWKIILDGGDLCLRRRKELGMTIVDSGARWWSESLTTLQGGSTTWTSRNRFAEAKKIIVEGNVMLRKFSLRGSITWPGSTWGGWKPPGLWKMSFSTTLSLGFSGGTTRCSEILAVTIASGRFTSGLLLIPHSEWFTGLFFRNRQSFPSAKSRDLQISINTDSNKVYHSP